VNQYITLYRCCQPKNEAASSCLVEHTNRGTWTFFPSISRCLVWLSGNAGSAMIIYRRVTIALRIRFVQYAAQGNPVSISPRGRRVLRTPACSPAHGRSLLHTRRSTLNKFDSSLSRGQPANVCAPGCIFLRAVPVNFLWTHVRADHRHTMEHKVEF
jgi:hypothetical protein